LDIIDASVSFINMLYFICKILAALAPYYDDNEEEEMMDFYPRRPARKALRFPSRLQVKSFILT
jgi:hypothetical protein